ncbi:MAG: transcriptional repressor [Cyanobacteriota bacterium]|nr:transcriptional repressor [Cyanobacteriota bacterium]
MTGSSPAINARQKVLMAALKACGDELSGQQLHRSLNQEDAMGLATVYRNLRQLHQRGLVRCRHLPNGEALYAPVERDRHHLTCVDCGKTRPLDQCPIHGLKVPAENQRDFDLLFHTLEFYGLCLDCRQRQEAPS